MYLAYFIVILGFSSAFGPLVIDMYLPALPKMSEVFQCSASAVQLGLTFCMIGLACGQLFFGPLSDKYGRKPILYLSLLLYLAANFVCCVSLSIEIFTIGRFFQGFGGAGAITFSRSAPTDLYHGRQLAKIIAFVGAVNGIAPVAAPVIGGFISQYFGWKGIFELLFVVGLLLGLMSLPIKETLPKENRLQGSGLSSFKGFIELRNAKGFFPYCIVFGLAMATLFAYISSSPFVLQQVFELSQIHFSLIFACNAVGISLGAMVALKVSTTSKASLIGVIGALIFATIGLIFSIFDNNLYTYEGSLFCMLVLLGFVFTGASTQAMNNGRKYAGSAAALVGCIGFAFGGIISPLAGLGNIVITSFALCCISLVSALIILLFFGEHEKGNNLTM